MRRVSAGESAVESAGEVVVSTQRLLSFIKAAVQRSSQSEDKTLCAQQLNAMVQVMCDRISELERENAALRLNAKYGRKYVSCANTST